jgi:diaminohydroxyphosphoribosylaminopyrimidine deaminase/5-amino-6-(5-phosphoribosylamino)uracil reductase
MRRAIELARRGFPAPNPHVGCVIVAGGAVVGEGWHEYAGAPHAEAMALAEAGDRARGATVYVTLEPCNHQGRRGPCSVALLDAGVARVVYACPDPNPRAVGGAERLRQAGVQVECGLLRDEAEAVAGQFHFAHRAKRPLIVAKVACSMDGRVALPDGASKWITGPEARHEGHRLRAELGAVLVGRGTVQADDPRLTARIDGVVNQPVRIVLDPNARLTGSETVFGTEAETIHVTGLIDLPALVASLYARDVTGVLIEGGPTTLSHFMRAGLVDRLEIFMAPKILGAGAPWLNDIGMSAIPEEAPFRFDSVRQVGTDLWVTATPTRKAEA